MKKIISLALVLSMSILAFAQQKGAVISWEETSYNFDIVKTEEEFVKHKFIFINIGDEPLILINVKPDCGCTTVDYTKEPILPKAKGFVEVSYDTQTNIGSFTKMITVTSNEKLRPLSILKIKGEVIASEIKNEKSIKYFEDNNFLFKFAK